MSFINKTFIIMITQSLSIKQNKTLRLMFFHMSDIKKLEKLNIFSS